MVEKIIAEELAKLGDNFKKAAELIKKLTQKEDFEEFLTLPAYNLL